MTDENQLDERIRASLSRRAESVQVEPDLAGLARQAGPRRSAAERFPLVAVAIVIAALAVTTAALRPATGPDSHVISRSGNQRDRTENPTSLTSGATSTSRPGPDRMSTTTSTNVPTTVLPTEGTTPSTEPGESPGDGTGATPEPEPDPADPCTPVEGVIAAEPWEGDVLFVAEYGRNGTLRHMNIWRDPGGDACPALVTEPGGERFSFSLPIPGGTPFESHAIRCIPPGFEFVEGYTDDQVTWRFTFRTYAVNGGTASLVEERSEVYVEPADHDTIDALRLTCGAPGSGG